MTLDGNDANCPEQAVPSLYMCDVTSNRRGVIDLRLILLIALLVFTKI